MQLKYNNYIRNNVIHMELETTNFTEKENRYLEKLGEPVIKFEKTYAGGHSVAFEKRIKTGFKLRIRFDGTDDMEAAAQAANEFFFDIEDELKEAIVLLTEKAVDIGFEVKKGYIDIVY